MCGVSSSALIFTCYLLVRCEAFIVTERNIFAFFQHSSKMRCMQFLWPTEGGSPFCLCSTTWWATMAVSASEKVLWGWCVVQWEVRVCVCVCCHQRNFFLFQCCSYLSHCTCFTLGGAFLVFLVQSAWMKYDVWTAVF